MLWIGAQSINIRFDGTIKNMDNANKESGVTVSIVQGGSTITSTTSASNGRYLLKHDINYKQPFTIVFSKSGFVSKRVYFDLTKIIEEDLPASTEYKPLQDLSIDLFTERPNIDFSFLMFF